MANGCAVARAVLLFPGPAVSGLARGVGFELARVLVVVAVETEQFPVAAVLGIVVVVVIAMMYG